MVGSEPACIQRTQVFDATSQTEGELLHRTGAGLGPERGVDANGAQREPIGADLEFELGHLVVSFFKRDGQGAGVDQFADRIGQNGAVQVGCRSTLNLQPGREQRGHRTGGNTRVGEHRHGRQVHPAQGAIDVVDTRQRQTALGGQTRFGRIETEAHGGLQRQADGVLTAFEIVEKRGVKRGRIRAVGFLANGPALGALAERVAAAGVGRQSWPALGQRGGVFARVDRAQIDALVGARDQFFLKRRPVEGLLGGLAPIGGSSGRKIGE